MGIKWDFCPIYRQLPTEQFAENLTKTKVFCGLAHDVQL